MNKKLSKKYLTSLTGKLWAWLWKTSLWRRTMTVLAVIAVIAIGFMYGIAEWYIHTHSNRPIDLGTTFIPNYARQLGVDPEQTLQAILKPVEQGGLGMKHVRLVSYWEDVEPTPGVYDFSKIDWQFAMANKYGAKVSLAVGLRQPRWPECHTPLWATQEPKYQWDYQLNNFISAVVNHYKNNPALESYQLENEFFMKIFGKCTDFDRSRFVAEYNLVKKLDPKHKIIISRSNNWIGVPVREPTPDEFGISIYKRVWDYHFTNRYVEYPLPSWYYAFLAGLGKIISGKDMMVHELQAEPWLPDSQKISASTLSEQAKSFSPHRFADRIEYAKDTGMKTIELWGAEYWYWMMVNQNDPSYWQIVQHEVATAAAHNAQLR